MNQLLEAAEELQTFLQAKGWPFAFLGGLAVNRWGRPRTTSDADVALFTGFGSEQTFIEEMLGRFRARISDAGAFAAQSRVLLLQSSTSVGIDVSLAALPFEEQAISRATDFRYPNGTVLTTVSAEDLVVLKSMAGRPQDWLDVEGILVRQAASLDVGLIRRELEVFAGFTESDTMLAEFERIWLLAQGS